MRRRETATALAGVCLLVLAGSSGCQGAQKGYVSVSAIEGSVRIVADRHDAYVAADTGLSESERQTRLRTTELLRQVVNEASK